MYRLALRTLRFRKGGFAATFVAILFGAVIVMACGGLMETGVRTNVAPQRLAAAPVVVTGNPAYRMTGGDHDKATMAEQVRISANLVPKIEFVDGVRKAIPDLSFPAALLADGQPSRNTAGHAWSAAALAPYRLTAGAAPRPGQVVLDAALHRPVGSTVRLLVHGVPERMRVAGTVTADGVDQHAIFFADPDATRFAGHAGMVDSIGVFADPGISAGVLQKRVAKVAGDAIVLKGADRGVAEFPEAARDRSNLIVLAGVFGGMACTVTLFVVASTLTLAAQHRQRELALLRTIGTTPRQVRRMIFAEAAVIGVLATAASLLPAGVFGRWLFRRLTGHGLVPDVVSYYQGWIPRLAGIGAALLVTLGAALVAARRAGRAKPVEALVEAGLQRHWLGPFRLLGALLFLGGGGALAGVTIGVMHGPIAASTAGPSVLCWAIGLALLGPGVTKLVFALLYLPVRALTGLGGRLALQNARARAVPMAAAVMPLMLASGLATANLYMQTTQMHAAEQAYTHNVRADAVLSAGAGMPAGVLPQVRALPGVTAAAAYVGSAGMIDQPRISQDEAGWPLQGVTGSTAAQVLSVPVRAGRLTDLRGNTVALPTALAHKLHRGIGDTITMRLGDRTAVSLRIVAVYSAKRGYETIMLPVELLAAHTTNGLPEQILVRGHDVMGGLSSIAGHWPGVQVADRKVLIKHYQADQRTQAWVNYLMVGMIVAYTVIAVANTLIAGTGRRRRELGLARLTGATRGQLMRMLTVEGGLVAAAGILLGTAIALLTLLPFCAALGAGARPYGPLWIYLAVMGSAVVLALASTLLPGRLAVRSAPAEAALVAD